MNEIILTWLGTASIKIETENNTLLIDPFVELPGGENKNSLNDFLGADYILITHPHLDHLMSLPDILREYTPTVYCTGYAKELLIKKVGAGDNIVKIEPGNNFNAGDMEITVYKGKHIRFDAGLVAKTLNPIRLQKEWRNSKVLLHENRYYQENKETVFYELNINNLRLQVMGSLALADDVNYPKGADILFLPYQGNSNLLYEAESVTKRLNPKSIFMTHFDNAFPPISQTIPTDEFVEMVNEKYPDIAVTVPVFKKKYKVK